MAQVTSISFGQSIVWTDCEYEYLSFYGTMDLMIKQFIVDNSCIATTKTMVPMINFFNSDGMVAAHFHWVKKSSLPTFEEQFEKRMCEISKREMKKRRN